MPETKPSTRETLPRCKTSIRDVSMLALAQAMAPASFLDYKFRFDEVFEKQVRIWILSCNIVILHAAHSMLCHAKDSL